MNSCFFQAFFLGIAVPSSPAERGAAFAFGVWHFFQATFAFLGPAGQSCVEEIMEAAHKTKDEVGKLHHTILQGKS